MRPRDSAGRLEGFERVQLLARAGELDRFAGDKAHGKRRAAARIAVHPGEHHARQRHLVGKVLRNIHRILPGQGIDHQQHFGRRGDGGHRLHLRHQRLIDVQPPGGIEEQHVETLQAGGFQGAAGDVDRLLALDDRQGRDLGLFAKHRQLLLRGGPLYVERGHQRLLAPLLAHIFGKLGRARRLARALQADHHHDDRRLGLQHDVLVPLAAKHLDQFVIDDLDHLLSRRDRAQHVLPDRLFGDRIDEAANDRQCDVGFEESDPHLAHGVAHVLLAQRAAPFQPVENSTPSRSDRLSNTMRYSFAAKARYGQSGVKCQKRRRTKPRRPASRISNRNPTCMILRLTPGSAKTVRWWSLAGSNR